MFADYWPTVTTETDKAADMLNTTPKIVFSKTLDRAPLFGDTAPELELKLLETRRFDRGTVVLKYAPSDR